MHGMQVCDSANRKGMRQVGFMGAKGIGMAQGTGGKSNDAAADSGQLGDGQSFGGQRQSEGGDSCQQEVDAKAFTGRGDLHRLRQIDREVDRLELLMDQLAKLSKDVAGAEMYLAKHRRHSTGYAFLRWREAGGRKRHLSWELAQKRWTKYDRVTRDWYAQLSKEAMQVNQQHVDARRRSRSILHRVAKTKRQAFARHVVSSE